MRARASELIDALRRPEYVGENRCLPCTVVNVAVALAGSALVARSRNRRGRLFATGTLAGSLATIYLRGYLVPGTPELTKRYLPERVLAAFGKEPTREGTRYGGWEPIDDDTVDVETGDAEQRGSGSDDAATEDDMGGDTDADEGNRERETMERIEYRRENEVDPEAFLASIDAVEPTADGTDLRLTDEFAESVEAGLERHREEPRDLEALADLFDVDRAAVTVKDRDYPAIAVGQRIRKWPSDGALVADLATAEAIEDRTDRWRAVPLEQRVEILEALRAFHERCPSCGGPISMSSDTVESCCRSYEVATLGCEECESPLLEFDPDAVERRASDAGARL
ncbi:MULTISPECIES: hypothetical protein [Saliphagus]|uniref:Uncharacterized protein n=1 Tax=Saliphagus infecundisoli TaxID=1849069 RepID=A0ABD5Q9S0_9EURY|nr:MULTISPECIES: hypothetical protein [Saliphagus]